MSRVALPGYTPASASATPCSSMPACPEAHRWKYHGSHLVIPWGVQYNHLLPEITMPCIHRTLLIDLHMGESFPMVPVRDFQLVDKIFPGMPRDSLLYNSDDLAKFQSMRFQVVMHRTEELPAAESKEKPQSSCTSGEVTSKNGEPSLGLLAKDIYRLSK